MAVFFLSSQNVINTPRDQKQHISWFLINFIIHHFVCIVSTRHDVILFNKSISMLRGKAEPDRRNISGIEEIIQII